MNDRAPDVDTSEPTAAELRLVHASADAAGSGFHSSPHGIGRHRATRLPRPEHDDAAQPTAHIAFNSDTDPEAASPHP